jgi:hypothetical protein
LRKDFIRNLLIFIYGNIINGFGVVKLLSNACSIFLPLLSNAQRMTAKADEVILKLDLEGSTTAER